MPDYQYEIFEADLLSEANNLYHDWKAEHPEFSVFSVVQIFAPDPDDKSSINVAYEVRDTESEG